MSRLLLPLLAAYTGVVVLFLGERAERARPTFSGGGGFFDLGPDISDHGLAMKGGYYLALLGGFTALALGLRLGARVDRLALSVAPVAAAALLVAFYWPPLTAEAYGGHADDYTERPFPFVPAHAQETLEREHWAPGRMDAALATFETDGITPTQLKQELDRNGIVTNPVETTYTEPPQLLTRTRVAFFATSPMVNELYFVVYRDSELAAAKLEDARRSNYCRGDEDSGFARYANVIAVAHTCEPGRPLRTGLEPAEAVLRSLGAAPVRWLGPLPGPPGSGGLDEPSPEDLLEQDAKAAAAVVSRRLGIELEIWNGDGASFYLRPVASGRDADFELVVSADAATALDLVERNYLSAIRCSLDEPRPLLSGRVILRAATIPGCRPWNDQPALAELLAEISRLVG